MRSKKSLCVAKFLKSIRRRRTSILGTLGIYLMELLIDSFISAISLVISLDREMVDIVAVSLKVSCYSTRSVAIPLCLPAFWGFRSGF
jgi:hypothetical protein